jgi:hypothetical protein
VDTASRILAGVRDTGLTTSVGALGRRHIPPACRSLPSGFQAQGGIR